MMTARRSMKALALTDEIKALAAGIVALDKSVAGATGQRKEENSWPSS